MATLARSLTMPNGDEYTFQDPSVPEWARGETKPTYTAAEVGALPDTTVVPTKTSDLTNDSGFLTSESDPIFSASAASGITAADISNWNAKVSDDKKWNGVSLDKTSNYGGGDVYIPYINSTSGNIAYLVEMRDSVSNRTVAVRTANGYLRAATPSADNNSTIVATTAYVKSQGYLTLADLPVYDGSVT